MGQRFGYDFSSVRVHSGAAARRSAAGMNAKAYTVGRDIVFAPGQFSPGTRGGQRLIAHELAHVVQQSSLQPAGSLPPAQSGMAHLEAQAARAAADFGSQRPLVVTGRGVPAIARSPGDHQEDVADEEWYQADRAEDIARSRAKPVRGGQSVSTPGSVAREAEHEITRMLADATAGKYRFSSLKTKAQLVGRFRGVLRSYRVDEMMRIESELEGTLSQNQRSALVSQKRGIVVDRNSQLGKFDEAVRTPRGEGVSVQQKYVRGGLAKPYHETTPGKGSYAQPDYSVAGESMAGGRTQIHVNLKANALSSASPADARAIARAARDQAMKNASGSPKRQGDLGHLLEGDEVVISFNDKPPREIQAEMAEILFEEQTPISQVRFGESTWHRPLGQSKPSAPPLETLLSRNTQTTSQDFAAAPRETETGLSRAGAPDPVADPVAEVQTPQRGTPASGTTEVGPVIGPSGSIRMTAVLGLAKLLEIAGTILSAVNAKSDFEHHDYVGGTLNTVAAIGGVTGLVLPTAGGLAAGVVETGGVAAPLAMAWEGTKNVAELAAWQGQCQILVAKFETGQVTNHEVDELLRSCPEMMIGQEETQRVMRAWLNDEWPGDY
jgi:hypothetical protein